MRNYILRQPVVGTTRWPAVAVAGDARVSRFSAPFDSFFGVVLVVAWPMNG